MSQRKLHIARGLRLDPDYVGGGTFALLAKKGAGKTYLGRVLAEEMWEAKVPFVALDPMDAWWGLRSSADGKDEGIPVAVFGGPHADAPLERGGGKLMADLVVDEGLSMVLSLKHFGTRAAERQFAMEFLERLYRRNSELVHLFIDEADLFAPQRPQAGDQPLLGITENIVRRGRNSGIGATLITQRPAVLNKDVLTQVDGLVAMRMLGPQDRNAIDAWVGEHGDTKLAKSVKDSLPSLPTGECWWWVPELDVLQRVKVRRSRTFDSSPTRKRGAKAREPKSFADVDMGSIEEKMAETIERAKAEDPKELRKELGQQRKRITELERELEKRPEAEPETVEVPVLGNGALDTLEAALGEADRIVRDRGEITQALHTAAEGIREELRRVEAAVQAPSPRRVPAATAQPATAGGSASTEEAGGGRAVATARPPAQPIEIDGDVKLGRPERAILSVVVQFPEGRTKTQISILTGYSGKSSSFSNALGRLRSLGLISPAGREPITATAEGVALAGDVEPVPTGPELYAHWLGKLGRAERAILQVLYDAGAEELTKEEISERSGYSVTSSSFSNALGKLRSLELVVGLRASDELY